MKYSIKDCKEPWESIQILSNGNVRPCCWCSGIIGNLNSSSIDDIFNGKVVNELREYMLQDKLHSICENSGCKYVQKLEME